MHRLPVGERANTVGRPERGPLEPRSCYVERRAGKSSLASAPVHFQLVVDPLDPIHVSYRLLSHLLLKIALDGSV